MKLVIAFLLIAVAFATRETVQPAIENGGLTMAEVQQIEELRNTKWGSIFLTMAELQSQVGPIERLIQALDDLLKELSQSKASEKKRYLQKKAAHEASVSSLNGQIKAANAEINQNKQLISHNLIPKQKQAEADIVRAENNIAQKKNDIKKAQKQRALDHAGFEQRVADHNNAIGATDQALALLNGLVKGSASLVEVRQATMSIRRLEASIKRSNLIEAPFLEALITLASEQNFANKASVQKVLSLLNEFRAKLARSLELERKNEAASVAAFNANIVQFNKEIDDLTASIRKNTQVIAETKIAIDNAKNQILVKSGELLELSHNLDAEKESWRQETVTHKDIVAEINKELKVVGDCKTLFAKNQFSKYVSGKLANGKK